MPRQHVANGWETETAHRVDDLVPTERLFPLLRISTARHPAHASFDNGSARRCWDALWSRGARAGDLGHRWQLDSSRRAIMRFPTDVEATCCIARSPRRIRPHLAPRTRDFCDAVRNALTT